MPDRPWKIVIGWTENTTGCFCGTLLLTLSPLLLLTLSPTSSFSPYSPRPPSHPIPLVLVLLLLTLFPSSSSSSSPYPSPTPPLLPPPSYPIPLLLLLLLIIIINYVITVISFLDERSQPSSWTLARCEFQGCGFVQARRRQTTVSVQLREVSY